MPTWAAAVFEDNYPVRWLGRQAVVTLPKHIDVSNAGLIRGICGGASATGDQDPPPDRPPPPGAS